MSRKSAREVAVHMIYEYGYQASGIEEILAYRFSPEFLETVREDFSIYTDIDDTQRAYIRRVVQGVEANLAQIDESIKKHSIGWNLKRISRIAMAIMRVAVFEANYLEEIPPSVAINEAVEIAKKYASSETVAFINGILGSVVREEPKG